MIYSDKPYAKECDGLERIFRAQSTRPVARILDFSCGTGGHAIELANRGYDVIGTDTSPYMIRMAKQKLARTKNLSASFSVRAMTFGGWSGRFDAAISMFDSINYLSNLVYLEQTLTKVRRVLRKESLLIVQSWNGAAVARLGCRPRKKVVGAEELKLIREAQTLAEPMEQKCRITYRTVVKKGNAVVDMFEETHIVTYFFKPQLEYLLMRTGFEPIQFRPLDRPRSANENDWSVLVIARAC